MSDKEDAFGTIPAPVDESIPTWHIPPSVTIPFVLRELNKPNAAILLYHPSPSIRMQAEELLDGMEALKKDYIPDRHEMAMWYMSLDEDGRKEYNEYMDRCDSAEDYFKQQQKG